MTSTGQRDFVFAQTRRQIQLMLAAIARKDRNFDYKSCKSVIKKELLEAERVTKELLSTEAGRNQSSELTHDFMKLQDEVSDTLEKYKAMKRSNKCQWYFIFINDVEKIKTAQLIVRILSIMAVLILFYSMVAGELWFYEKDHYVGSTYRSGRLEYLYDERFESHEPLYYCPVYYSSPCYQQSLLCVLSLVLSLCFAIKDKCATRFCSAANRYLMSAFELFSCALFSLLWVYYLSYYTVGALRFDNNGAYLFGAGLANFFVFILWVLLTVLSALRMRKRQNSSVVPGHELQAKSDAPIEPPCYSAA